MSDLDGHSLDDLGGFVQGKKTKKKKVHFSHSNSPNQNRKRTASLSMISMKLLRKADGGAIEKIPLATAVASSIKHQKKPLKEEEKE